MEDKFSIFFFFFFMKNAKEFYFISSKIRKKRGLKKTKKLIKKKKSNFTFKLKSQKNNSSIFIKIKEKSFEKQQLQIFKIIKLQK